jgi:hypothetical protein
MNGAVLPISASDWPIEKSHMLRALRQMMGCQIT